MRQNMQYLSFLSFAYLKQFAIPSMSMQMSQFLFLQEWIKFYYVCHIFFIHLSNDGHLGWFHLCTSELDTFSAILLINIFVIIGNS